MAGDRFASEYELQRVVQRCHNILWERHGFDPAQAFDEFSKLLFVKLYDESRPISLSSSLLRHVSPSQFAAQMRWLFEEANNAPGFANIFDGDDAIVADDLAVFEVFRQLRDYSLLQTTSDVGGADVKGTIYENMIGNTFRGELGQFFTHRSIVEFMVRLVGVTEEMVVYDPSCGSAGFLIMCARLIRESAKAREPGITQELLSQKLKEYSRRCLVGTEINERTARVAKLNLLMHGCSYDNVFTANALRVEDNDDKRLTSLVKENAFDVILANPPFAGYEKDPAVLDRFELGCNGHGRAASLTREVLFIEQITRLLRPEGVAGIVIPQGIFTNRSLARVRDYIKKHSQILAVIELPDWAFIPSGTSVRGSLLFIRKREAPPASYNIFMKRVQHIGFTSTGRPDNQNDFEVTLAELRRSESSYMIPVQEVGDRIDAKFYLPEHRATIDLFSRNRQHPLVRLCDIGTFDVEKANPGRLGKMSINLIETNCVDVTTLTVAPKTIPATECSYTLLKKVRAGDILISRRRSYRGAIVVIPPALDGALAIPEFSVLRLRDGISRDYVVEILRSAEFLSLMTIYSTGEMSGRIAEKDLTQLKIPLPKDQALMGVDFASLRAEAKQLRQRAEDKRRQLADMVRHTVRCD